MVNYEEDPRILREKWGEGLREGMNLLHSIRGLCAWRGQDKDFCLRTTATNYPLLWNTAGQGVGMLYLWVPTFLQYHRGQTYTCVSHRNGAHNKVQPGKNIDTDFFSRKHYSLRLAFTS